MKVALSQLSNRFLLVMVVFSYWGCSDKEEINNNFVIKAFDLEMIEFIGNKEDFRFVAKEIEQNEESEKALEFKMVSAGNSYAGSVLHYRRTDDTAVIDNAEFRLASSSLSGEKVYYDGKKVLLTAEEALITGSNYQLSGKDFIYYLDRNDFRFGDGGSGKWSKED